MTSLEPKPFIFVHIPKCAGTSIEQALIPSATGKTTFKDFEEVERSRYWLPNRTGRQHATLQEYALQMPVKTYFSFGFVRNPWDRAVSQVRYLHAKVGKKLFPSSSFRECLQVYCSCEVVVWHHDLRCSQIDYLSDQHRRLAVDFVGRFESLAEDFASVCRTLGVAPIQLPHVFNSHRREHYSEYYDDDMAALVGKRFCRDVKKFGYVFERVVSSRDIILA